MVLADHSAQAYVDAYLEVAEPGEDRNGPLFRSCGTAGTLRWRRGLRATSRRAPRNSTTGSKRRFCSTRSSGFISELDACLRLPNRLESAGRRSAIPVEHGSGGCVPYTEERIEPAANLAPCRRPDSRTCVCRV